MMINDLLNRSEVCSLSCFPGFENSAQLIFFNFAISGFGGNILNNLDYLPQQMTKKSV